MNKLKLLFLLVCVGVLSASPALSAQIGGKSLGDVDDVVKEATHGSLEIPKHSLMLLRYGTFSENTEFRWYHNYSQANVITFNNSGNTAMKTVQVLSHDFGSYYKAPAMNVAPTISRRNYNGKKVIMWNVHHDRNTFFTNFAALRNSRTSSTENPRDLVNPLSASPIGNPYETTIPYDGWSEVVNVFGGFVLNVKGYDGEVFVATCGFDETTGIYGSSTENFDVFMTFFRRSC